MKRLIPQFMTLLALFLGLADQASAREVSVEFGRSFHCLTHGRSPLVVLSGGANRKVFGAIDISSARPTRLAMIVVQDRRNRLDGFLLQIDEDEAGQVYDIVNNGSFRARKGRLFATNPPFGGLWTQDMFERNVRTAVSRGALVLPKVDAGRFGCRSLLQKEVFR